MAHNLPLLSIERNLQTALNQTGCHVSAAFAGETNVAVSKDGLYTPLLPMGLKPGCPQEIWWPFSHPVRDRQGPGKCRTARNESVESREGEWIRDTVRSQRDV